MHTRICMVLRAHTRQANASALARNPTTTLRKQARAVDSVSLQTEMQTQTYTTQSEANTPQSMVITEKLLDNNSDPDSPANRSRSPANSSSSPAAQRLYSSELDTTTVAAPMSLLNLSATKSPGVFAGDSANWREIESQEGDGVGAYDMSFECPAGANVAVWQLENIRQFT
jgi:hypothetical protein